MPNNDVGHGVEKDPKDSPITDEHKKHVKEAKDHDEKDGKTK